jgi:hypothetical protein
MTVIQTNMAAAMTKALEQSRAKGHNPGRVGGQILRNIHKGVGSRFMKGPKDYNKSTAVSAA